jgi:hypothetical protein
MLAEKELQGTDLQGKNKVGTTYTPRSLGLPKASSYRVPPPGSKDKSGVKLSSSRPFSLGKSSMQEPLKSASSVTSTGHTPGVKCHRFHGFGHM